MFGHESNGNEYEYLSGSRRNFFLNSVHELVAGDALTAKNNSSRGSGPYIAEKIGSTVIILAQNGVSHGVGIKCSEVIIFGLKAI